MKQVTNTEPRAAVAVAIVVLFFWGSNLLWYFTCVVCMHNKCPDHSLIRPRDIQFLGKVYFINQKIGSRH